MVRLAGIWEAACWAVVISFLGQSLIIRPVFLVLMDGESLERGGWVISLRDLGYLWVQAEGVCWGICRAVQLELEVDVGIIIPEGKLPDASGFPSCCLSELVVFTPSSPFLLLVYPSSLLRCTIRLL